MSALFTLHSVTTQQVAAAVANYMYMYMSCGVDVNLELLSLCECVCVPVCWQCNNCEAVYHKSCKTPVVQCPKCRRLNERRMKLGKLASSLGDNDYSCSVAR